MEGKVKQKIPLVEEIKAAISKKGWNDATLARDLNIIAGRLDDLSDRIKAQGNALQGLQDDCLKVKNDIQDIYKRMTDAAESNNVRRLKKVG